MIVDSSAIMAILLQEAEAEAFAWLLEKTDIVFISACNVLELHIVCQSRGVPGDAVDTILERFGVNVLPFTLTHLTLAVIAHRQYGKGNHDARLNFGDCFAYALAKETGYPLLYKGVDFAKTDIASAA